MLEDLKIAVRNATALRVYEDNRGVHWADKALSVGWNVCRWYVVQIILCLPFLLTLQFISFRGIMDCLMFWNGLACVCLVYFPRRIRWKVGALLSLVLCVLIYIDAFVLFPGAGPKYHLTTMADVVSGWCAPFVGWVCWRFAGWVKDGLEKRRYRRLTKALVYAANCLTALFILFVLSLQ